MTASSPTPPPPVVLSRAALDSLLASLAKQGYRVLGPKAADGAVQYLPIASTNDMPEGLIDEQSGGSYRLKPGPRPALFDHTVGPHNWKRHLFPPEQRLWQASRSQDGFSIDATPEEAPKQAFIGVRPCELAAISIQDRVFDNGVFTDNLYKARRENALIVVVNCGRAAATCFCASMNTGPRAKSGFDLALTELMDGGRHDFLVEVGSDKGAKVLAAVSPRAAQAADMAESQAATKRAEKGISRKMVDNPAALLKANLEHPQWDKAAERCLNCANCTMVCPTCFCSTVEDVTDLTGDHAERWRKWDSCFTVGFSYIHGGSLRREARARYRQWMTHKLASWHEQFGSSGCTGCGRCISWCPVGIDITEEARAIKAAQNTTPQE